MAPLKLVTTRYLLKARCYTAFIKNPLLHNTSKIPLLQGTSKVRYYTAPLKSVATRHLLKPVATQQYFYKILQNPNTNLAPILQSPNTNLTLFYKAQILIWHYFTKPKY